MTEVKKTVALHATRFKSAEYERNLWVITPESGVSFEDLSSPRYWANVAMNLKPYDKIEVRADDGSYYGELLVTYVGNQFVQTKPISYVDLGAEQSHDEVVGGLDVMWRGPHCKWSVIRKKDNGFDVLSEQHANKSVATKWAAEHAYAAK